MNMKKIITLAAMIGSLFLFASCGGKTIDPDDSGNEVEKPEDKPEDDGPYVDGSGTVAGHEALDLGTGILWATTNIGAENPQDYGTYFSWGEVAKKETYTWANYKWSDGFVPQTTKDYEELKMTKYCLFKVYGTKDDKKVLEPADDAAAQIWKNGWRMPTKAEVEDLLAKCEWEWSRVDGLYGYKISSKKTGKSIFLPAAGMIAADGSHNSAFMCNYWTSSLHDQNEQYYAYSFVYLNDDKDENSRYISHTYRYLGMTIRPVCAKTKKN